MVNNSFSSTQEMDPSMIAGIVTSVVRDRSLSSAYGLYLSLIKEQTGAITAPPLDDFFSSTVAERLRHDMQRLGEDSGRLILYSGVGDLFSQLSRLLIACNERLANEREIISKADETIGRLKFRREVNDESHIRHLRNAVLHGHFSSKVNKDDPFKTLLYFWDENPRAKCLKAEYWLTAEELHSIINILIDDVCLRYLETVGWQIA